VGYDPYGIVSSNLQSTPLNSGKRDLSALVTQF
jgi:hypothetical protein